MRMSLKLVAAAAALASVFALTACDDKGSSAKKAEEPKAAAETKTAANEPLKVGFVYVAPIADVGYTKQHDIGRLYAIDKVGKDKITTTFVENVPETADAERVIRQMINDGNKLIFGTSFGYMNYMQKLAKEYPDVTLEHMYVDNAAMQLVRAPKKLDVLVTGNLFGDILSDEAAMLTGSIGMLASAALNEKKQGLFEPSHGSAPDIAGQNIANPLAQILSAAMMLRYSLDMPEAADKIEKAVKRVLAEGYRTGDIWSEGCKKVTCSEMGDAVVAALQ